MTIRPEDASAIRIATTRTLFGGHRMLFTELADYPLPSGHVTEWMPVARPEAFVSDNRRITAPHEHYLDGNASWLGGVLRIGLRLDESALRGALTDWAVRHEVLRTTVRRTHGLVERRTADADAVSWAPSETSIMVDTRGIHQQLVSTFDSVLNPHVWPHCRVVTIAGSVEPGDEHFTLVFAADHSVMDAYSLLTTIAELEHLYRCRFTGIDHGLAPAGSHIDLSDLDRAASDSVDAEHRAVHRWAEFFDRCGGDFPAFPLPTGSPTQATAEHQSGLGFQMIGPDQVAQIATACRQLGHSMQTGIVAAMAIASARMTGADHLRFAMPMHTRDQPDLALSMGWFIGIAPIEVDLRDIDISTPAGHAAAMSAAAASIHASKDLREIHVLRIAEHLGGTYRPRFVMSYLDCRFTPGMADWSEWRAQTLRSHATSDDEVYFWIGRDATGLTLSARFPSNHVATSAVHDFIRQVIAVLHEFATVATPAVGDVDMAAIQGAVR
ncbi:condensation domain-containing protein [Williamsia sp. CHRR-6]|uniref:condensation domain-containing protein n=1 Tax=Williamsia sp. CHRR-6 TaxID=2835871 RepID=UPI001BDAE032|nr:condensation domain-containing protein [Williamsia sp. CHRR-6]MBT0566866.1 Aureobasidin A1 biosynthesis complex [Williamsia sp. CHRR-6]